MIRKVPNSQFNEIEDPKEERELLMMETMTLAKPLGNFDDYVYCNGFAILISTLKRFCTEQRKWKLETGGGG